MQFLTPHRKRLFGRVHLLLFFFHILHLLLDVIFGVTCVSDYFLSSIVGHLNLSRLFNLLAEIQALLLRLFLRRFHDHLILLIIQFFPFVRIDRRFMLAHQKLKLQLLELFGLLLLFLRLFAEYNLLFYLILILIFVENKFCTNWVHFVIRC